MSKKYPLCVLSCIVLLSGCHHYGVLVKRESELNCPTDIRKMVPWCAGEDSVFCCPCGPNEQFHGHKPTCWRPWQSSGAEWRDLHCEPICSQCIAGVHESRPSVVSQPIEILTPAPVGPSMLQHDGRDNGELGQPPTALPSKDDDPADEGEWLPEPEEVQQLGSPSDKTSSGVQKHQPWDQSAKDSSKKSLTNYFHRKGDQRKNQVADILVADKNLGLPKSGTPLQTATKGLSQDPRGSIQQQPSVDFGTGDYETGIKAKPQHPVRLPSVAPQQAILSQRESSSIKQESKPAVLAIKNLGKPFNAEPKTNSQPHDLFDSVQTYRKPTTPLTAQIVIMSAEPVEKASGQLSLLVSSNAQQDETAAKTAAPGKSELSIVSAVVNKPSKSSPIRLMTQETPSKTLSFKNMHSSKMTFVR